MRTTTSRVFLGCLSLALLASCAPEAAIVDLPDDGESVSVALSAVPTGMRCVRFTTLAGGRTFAQDFDVTGLPSLNAQVRGLPANVALSISADAYAVACSAITATTQAAWVSAPVAVTLTPGVVPPLSFALRPAGGVSGAVDFLFLSASPQSKAFPATVVGATSSVTFTITNIGPTATGALAVSFPAGTTQFTLGTNTCAGVALAVNGTCTVLATFAPTAAGAKSGTLNITGTPGGTLPIALSGTGVQAAVLALAPATQSFGTVAVGKSSPPVTYTVTNSGGLTTAPVVVTSPDPAFVVSGSTCDGLDKGQSCTVKVAFAPSGVAIKNVTLTATAGAVTATATVTGTGVLAPALSLTPSVLSFGTLFPGTLNQIPVTVKNVGGFPLSNLSVFVGGTDSGQFQIDGRGCNPPVGPASLGPNETCMFFVSVPAVDAGSSQTYNSTLLVTAAGANPASVMGTATATVAWPLQPNPKSFFFSGVKAGTTSTVNIQFTNIGPTAILPVTFSTTGPIFTVVGNSCAGFAIGPGIVCNITVRYSAPATAGIMSIDVLTASPVPGVGPNGVTVALRGTSAP